MPTKMTRGHGAQGLAAAVAGEDDRGRVEQQDERGEHVADRLQEAEARLGCGQLIRVHDLDRGRPRRQLGGHVRQPELCGDRRDHRCEVERHHPVGGRDELALVFDQGDQLALCGRARVDEELLDLGLGERLGDDCVGGAAKRSGERGGERRELRGKLVGELCLDVDVVEDRGDDEGVEGRLDVGVWISCSLVVRQVSVSSTWRLAQSANTETIPMIVARTMRMIGSAWRPVLFFGSPSLTGPPYRQQGTWPCGNPIPAVGRRASSDLGDLGRRTGPLWRESGLDGGQKGIVGGRAHS